jgi:hypothetical protein
MPHGNYYGDSSHCPLCEKIGLNVIFLAMIEDHSGTGKLQQLWLLHEHPNHQPQQAHIVFLTL